MPHAYVHPGFWTRYDAPLYTRWPLTLSSRQGAVLFCAGSICLSYVQLQAWVLVRFMTVKITMPIHLPSDINDLSQRRALASLAQYIRRVFMRSRHGEEDLWRYQLSPVFGLVAILNILLFIGAGVIIPYLLMDGVAGTTEVRSQRTDACLDEINGVFPGDLLADADVMQLDEVWEHCHGSNNVAPCDPNLAGLRGVSTVTSEDCLFPHNCVNDLPTVVITRANLTAHDLGINSKLKMTASHRMSCSPISLRSFTWKGPNDSGLGGFTLSIERPFQYRTKPYRPNANLSLPLWTNNTPGSGEEVFNKGDLFRLQVLPKNEPFTGPIVGFPINPSLGARNGKAFVIVLKQGRTLYSATTGPISDPFFSANALQYTSNSSTGKTLYLPDLEATALGCIEQVQVCLTSDKTCDPWSAQLRHADRAFKELRRSQGDRIAWDYFDVFSRSLEYSSVYAFLQRRLRLQRPALLAQYNYSNATGTGILYNIDSKRQWIYELEVLFTKASYWQKIQMLTIIQNDFTPEDAAQPAPPPWPLMRQETLCDRIIFRESGYVTINWIGLCAIILSLLVLWVLSYRSQSIEWLLETILAAAIRVRKSSARTDSCMFPGFHGRESIRFRNLYTILFPIRERGRYQPRGINFDTLQEEDLVNPI